MGSTQQRMIGHTVEQWYREHANRMNVPPAQPIYQSLDTVDVGEKGVLAARYFMGKDRLGSSMTWAERCDGLATLLVTEWAQMQDGAIRRHAPSMGLNRSKEERIEYLSQRTEELRLCFRDDPEFYSDAKRMLDVLTDHPQGLALDTMTKNPVRTGTGIVMLVMANCVYIRDNTLYIAEHSLRL